jgi:hypothetical protein
MTDKLLKEDEDARYQYILGTFMDIDRMKNYQEYPKYYEENETEAKFIKNLKDVFIMMWINIIFIITFIQFYLVQNEKILNYLNKEFIENNIIFHDINYIIKDIRSIIDNKSIFNINYIYIYYYNIYYYYYNIKLLYLKYLIRFSEIKTLKVNSWEEGTFLIFDFAVKLIIGILILQFLLINNI